MRPARMEKRFGLRPAVPMAAMTVPSSRY